MLLLLSRTHSANVTHKPLPQGPGPKRERGAEAGPQAQARGGGEAAA